MSREQMVAPFAEEELRQFTGRGGKVMTFIEDETVMDRLDAGYGVGNWQVQVDAVSEKVVKVRLGVREHGEWIWNEDFGYPNQDGGESLKEAVSDGIRRCGRYVGIARDLYRKSTYEPGGALGPPKPANGASVPVTPARPASSPDVRDGGLVGTVITQGTQDMELRQGPDGPSLPFRVKEGRSSVIVVAKGDMAQDLRLIRDSALGARVTVWGEFSDEHFDKGDQRVNYRALQLSRIVGPDWEIPAPKPTAAELAAAPPAEPELSADELDGIFAAVDKAPKASVA